MSAGGRPLGPWDPTTPMVPGNMATLINLVKRTMQVRDLHLLPTIRHVLKQKIGTTKYTELLTSNVRNGTNDQKRLILRVAQAYARHKNVRERSERSSGAEEKVDEVSGDDSDVEVLNKCMKCGQNPIDTINLPCQCETCCETCANDQVEHRDVCLKCARYVRGSRPIDSHYVIQCSSCGFIWDGNAQHECDAEEHIIFVAKQFAPVPSNPGLTHPVIPEKVHAAFQKAMAPFGSIALVTSEPAGDIYEFQLRDEWFWELKEELRKVGLRFASHEYSNEEPWTSTLELNPNSRQNIGGRYGPDKNRLIRIPNYQRRGLYGDYDQEKVRNELKDIAEFNWIREGLTGNYYTSISKMPDEKFKIIQKKLKRLKLRMVSVRSTYFDIAYNIIPKEGSPSAQHRYARTSLV